MSATEQPLDVTKESVQRLLKLAVDNQNVAEASKLQSALSYWNGYIRALEHILEMEDE